MTTDPNRLFDEVVLVFLELGLEMVQLCSVRLLGCGGPCALELGFWLVWSKLTEKLPSITV